MILPLLFVLIGSTALVARRQAILNRDAERLQLETVVTAEHLQIRLENWIDDRVAVITHIAETHSFSTARDQLAFRPEVEGFLDLYSGYQAINFIDQSGHIRVVVPSEGNLKALGKNLFEHPSKDVHQSISRARETGETTRTQTIQLLQGGTGFALYMPVFELDGTTLAGYLNGVFRIDTLIGDCLLEDKLRQRFSFQLTDPDGTLSFFHSSDEGDVFDGITTARQVRLVDLPMILTVAPSQMMAAGYGHTGYNIMLFISLTLVVIMGLVLRIYLLRQSQLAESRAKYKVLIENQAEIVIKTNADGECVFVSPSFCRSTGLPESELLNQHFLEMIHEEDHVSGLKSYDELLVPPHSSYLELRTRTTQGWRWYSWSSQGEIDSSGKITSVITVGREVTRRRELEDQLRHSQKMQAVGQLAGGIAHDFNNILQSIMGSLELARLDTEQDSQVFEDMDQAYKSAERAADLTRQLLAFSRRQVLQPLNILLDKEIDGIHGMLNRLVDDSMVMSFDLNCDHGVVFADATQIQQVLLNLCVNSRDAIRQTMNSEGRIRIRTQSEILSESFCRDNLWARPGSYHVLEVSDNGVGMDNETLSMIFEPFYTTKQTTGGTGLGLATVYGIVKQHNGLIHAVSEKDNGATFRVYLNQSQGPVLTTQQNDPAITHGGSETILMAEDDEQVRKFAARVLESAGYNVLIAHDGLEATEIFDRHRESIDLALLDVVMPHLGGRETRDHIHAASPEIPILFCRGYAGDSIHTSFILDEKFELLPKPYDGPTLLSRVRSLMDAAKPVASL